ncbi:hypothetical protein BU23DRAFT_476341 [Bimuria novae-zelandiae CBS 107.79]|uniref:Rhodopsin domain-containing protein n=1 Tax=Bimuria novae-zelandiae CBS 107.79 TaxID=1447943 RepID=A0A6A5UXS8_9PLEO|nr:hypothetical protein BU23DRAFT_476341 [Bimuria novae-zelandiae CBS 107.79]
MDSFLEIPDPIATSVDRTREVFGQIPTSNSLFNNTRPSFNPNRFRNKSADTNQAPVLLGVGGTLLFISICLLAARLWSRLKPAHRIKPDDLTVLAATILAVVQYLILAAAVFNGLGHRTIFVPSKRRSAAMRLLFISQLFWYWAVTLVKLSVALLLFRLKPTRPWRSFLYLIMGVTIAAAIVQTCFQFLQCRPFSVYWDPRVFKGVQCFRRSIINGNIIMFSSIQVALDLIFSFIPITFIRKLKRPRREKIFMCFLMGLGLFAACAAVVRTLTLQEYYTTSDLFRINVKIALWATLELQMALIAATMPTLKAFMERTLVRVGLRFYDEKNEGHVRWELVKLGLLDEGDVLVKDENMVVGRRPITRSVTEAKTAAASSEEVKGTMDNGVGLLNEEDEVTFDEMLLESTRAKQFL